MNAQRRRACARAADRLLETAGRAGLPVHAPPIPVDDICERVCGCTLDFDDLPRHLRTPGAEGALFVAARAVYVDERLDPDRFPARLGRFRFTVAHELGHLCLHAATAGAGGPACGDPRREAEADAFAACLLMPARLVRECLVAAGRAEAWARASGVRDPAPSSPEPEPFAPDERRARAVAEMFAVSRLAAARRLEELGLVGVPPRVHVGVW